MMAAAQAAAEAAMREAEAQLNESNNATTHLVSDQHLSADDLNQLEKQQQEYYERGAYNNNNNNNNNAGGQQQQHQFEPQQQTEQQSAMMAAAQAAAAAAAANYGDDNHHEQFAEAEELLAQRQQQYNSIHYEQQNQQQSAFAAAAQAAAAEAAAMASAEAAAQAAAEQEYYQAFAAAAAAEAGQGGGDGSGDDEALMMMSEEQQKLQIMREMEMMGMMQQQQQQEAYAGDDGGAGMTAEAAAETDAGMMSTEEEEVGGEEGGGEEEYDEQAAAEAMAQRVQELFPGIDLDELDEDQITILQEVMSMGPENPEQAQQLLQMVLQQQQQQQQQQQEEEEEMAATSAMLNSRPDEHYLTIAQNGAILEATKMITGFPPDALLMTSAYDAVFDEDLPGFLFIKTQFWDRGQSGVEVFLRRRSIEGDWVWLMSKSVSYVEEPIPAIIIQENRVTDEDQAIRINRITRITAILVQAVEAAFLTESQRAEGGGDDEEEEKEKEAAKAKTAAESVGAAAAAASMGPQRTEDAEAYRFLIDSMATAQDAANNNDETMESLMKIAELGGQVTNCVSKLEQDLKEQMMGEKKKNADPASSMIESVRKGVRLDLGLTRLQHDEIKMISLVLSGKIAVEDVATGVLHAMRSGLTLADMFRYYGIDTTTESSRSKRSPRQGLSPDRSHSKRSPMNNMPMKIPPVSVINLSYSYIGNSGCEMLAEVLCAEGSALRTLDISFCGIEEKGFLALSRGLGRRKRNGIPSLRGVILSGNFISTKSAYEVGNALSPAEPNSTKSRRQRSKRSRTLSRSTGYESDSAESDDDDEDEGEDFFDSRSSRRRRAPKKTSAPKNRVTADDTLTVLHVANTSITCESLTRLLEGLGPKSLLKELNLSSNNLGPDGAGVLVKLLDTKARSREATPMSKLDRLDMSNNNLGDNGTTQLTKMISKRATVHLVDLRLSSNAICAGGIETIMNKLLQHNLVSMSLDKNAIGDQGCQLVAASLQSMKALARLNLSFNQIGSRGINSLMRSLVACESITYLGLSGNILRISGAIALAFTLAQHPRLEELDLDNCCLGRAAQCHISAGIISNRWVPMKKLRGYAVGPPLVAIGALKPYAQSLGNEECFRIRKDEQMKTILQWMETNRVRNKYGADALDPNLASAIGEDSQNRRFLTPDYVSTINEIHGIPSQNAYFRLLGWLSRIPFDEDELTALQKYFYDPDGGEGDRGSDGYINLKLRGDLLAALDTEIADEIREDLPTLGPTFKGSIGIDLDKLVSGSTWDTWEGIKAGIGDDPPNIVEIDEDGEGDKDFVDSESQGNGGHDGAMQTDDDMTSGLGISKPDMAHSESNGSTLGREKSRSVKVKARITMFPRFEQQLEELKATATEMIEQEEDERQHEVILEQYAEASLTILRQLRYHCMNSGLDGWRQAGLKRKVLVIDDSTVTRKLVSRAFEKANFIVDTAADGAEGVKKMMQSIYDIAFMDIDMPVMNGFEATKKLREWEDKMRPGARQPICALTATYVDDFERSELMKFKEAGLDVMESKPCNIPRLFKVVDDVSPMFSDLSISVIQKNRSDSNSKLHEPAN